MSNTLNQKLTDLLTLVPVASADPGPGLPRITFRARIDPVFTIGPKVHGGSLQMLVARAARDGFTALAAADGAAPDSAVTPVALAGDFLAAPEPAEVDIEVRLLKRGRTVSIVTVDVIQGGRLMVTTSVTLARLDSGSPRHSAVTVLDGLPTTPPDDSIHIDASPMAEIVHHGPAIDLVLEAESFPALRGDTGAPVVRGWCRPKGSDADIDFAVLVCDISPPVVMNLGVFGWAPTVQLTTYVRRDPMPGWLRFASSSAEVGVGMFEEDHVVVDSSGAVVAQSRQLALIPQTPARDA